jgi:hypothetical protein
MPGERLTPDGYTDVPSPEELDDASDMLVRSFRDAMVRNVLAITDPETPLHGQLQALMALRAAVRALDAIFATRLKE